MPRRRSPRRAPRLPPRSHPAPPTVVSCVLLALALTACLPIPDIRLELDPGPALYRIPLEAVATSYELVDGAPEPHTPPIYNRSGVLRYGSAPDLDPASATDPDTILVLMPGIFGGAASFDQLARQLVASTPGLEVWAIDRRANLLEDQSGFERASLLGDAEIARRYYLDDAGRPGGFTRLDPGSVPFMVHWGVDVHLQDLHEVVLAAHRAAPVVFLGGHSLGASLASLYAAYRLPLGLTGADYLDGLVLLDGTLGRTGAFEREDVSLRLFGLTVFPALDDITVGEVSPFLDVVLTPDRFVRRNVIALAAAFDPNGDAPEGIVDYPISNRALAGLFLDDEYAPVPLFAASVGEAEGAEFDGNLLAVLLGGFEGVRSRSVVGVADGAERVEWSPGDPQRERTDLDALLSGYSYIRGVDFNEWYFPTRLGIEITLIDPSLVGDERFVPTAEVRLPTLAFGASRGLVASADGFATYANLRFGSPIGIYMLPRFTHIDVVTARQNPVVPILQRWLSNLTDPRFG